MYDNLCQFMDTLFIIMYDVFPDVVVRVDDRSVRVVLMTMMSYDHHQ